MQVLHAQGDQQLATNLKQHIVAIIIRFYEKLQPAIYDYVRLRLPNLIIESIRQKQTWTSYDLLRQLRINRKQLTLPVSPLMQTLVIWLTVKRPPQLFRELDVTLLLRVLEDLAVLAHELRLGGLRREISSEICELILKIAHPHSLEEPRELAQLRSRAAAHDVYAVARAMRSESANQYLTDVCSSYSLNETTLELAYFAGALGIHFPHPKHVVMLQSYNCGYFFEVRADWKATDRSPAHSLIHAEMEQLSYFLVPGYASDELVESFENVLKNPSELRCFASRHINFTNYLFATRYHEVQVTESVAFVINGFELGPEPDTNDVTLKDFHAALERGVPGAKLAAAIESFQKDLPEVSFQKTLAVVEDLTTPDSERRTAAVQMGLLYATAHGCTRNEELAAKWLQFGRAEIQGKILEAVLFGGAKMCELELLTKKFEPLFAQRQSRWYSSLRTDPTGTTVVVAPCAFCLVGSGTLKCPCGFDRYCSTECQKRGWPAHKELCRAKKKTDALS